MSWFESFWSIIVILIVAVRVWFLPIESRDTRDYQQTNTDFWQ